MSSARALVDRRLPEGPAGGSHRELQLGAVMSRPLVAVGVLLLLYIGLSFTINPNAFLGSDAGGKAASLHVMVHGHTATPDLGYWAEAWDPQGVLYPLANSLRVGGHWLNTTSLPMLLASAPLTSAFGARGALVLPMIGSVLTALGARALARRMGASSARAMLAFWAIGLASPATLYALQLWEHSLGLAGMVWGVVVLLEVARSSRPLLTGLAAGALFGAAATMRTEALVYGAVGTAIVLGTLLVRRHSSRALHAGVGALVGVAAPLVANDALERAVLGASLRSGRSTGAARGAAALLSDRAYDAMVTTFSAFAAHAQLIPIVVGMLLTVVILRTVLLAGDPRRARITALAAVGAVAIVFRYGLGFVPGLVPTMPAAAVGVLAIRRPGPARPVAAIALASLPVVWLFQFTGNMIPQWSGRYAMTSGVLLAVVGLVTMPPRPRWLLGWIVGLSLAVTVFGCAWMSVRTHDVGALGRTLGSRPENVLVSTETDLFREVGARSVGEHWLTAYTPGAIAPAFDVARQSGATAVGLVQSNDGTDLPDIPGWQPVHTDQLGLYGEPLSITTYRRR